MTNQSPNTIVYYINIFRDLIINTLNDNDQRIRRLGIICEIDESKFEKNKNWWLVS
jgi:hypothetical protein